MREDETEKREGVGEREREREGGREVGREREESEREGDGQRELASLVYTVCGEEGHHLVYKLVTVVKEACNHKGRKEVYNYDISLFFPQAVKYPKSAYRYLQLLIGQKFESPLVQKYKEWFPFYDLKKDEERGKHVCTIWPKNLTLIVLFADSMGQRTPRKASSWKF